MKTKEIELIREMLKDYADRLSNDSCNDWDFPKDWTNEEKELFLKQYHAWNGDPEEYDPKRLYIGNSSVAAFLAYRVGQKNHDYVIKIKSIKEIESGWVAGYLSERQRKDLLTITSHQKMPFSVRFKSGGIGVVVKVYDENCKLLLDLTEYE